MSHHHHAGTGNHGGLLMDHSKSGGSLLPKLKHVTFIFILILAFTLPMMH
jgi:hypothetical protein